MRNEVMAFVDRLSATTDVEEIHVVIQDIAAEFACAHYMKFFGRLSHDAHTFPGTMFETQPVCLHNFPPAWSELYHGQALFRIDPVFLKSVRSVFPVIWHEEEAKANEEGRNFFAMAREHGLATGITVPVHTQNGGYGTLGLAFSRDDPETRSHIESIAEDVHIIGFHAYTNLRRIVSPEEIDERAISRLTPRETEVLRWTAAGKTVWEISTVLSITERTAKQHIDNAMRKLGVHNKYHAVAEAVALGLTKAW